MRERERVVRQIELSEVTTRVQASTLSLPIYLVLLTINVKQVSLGIHSNKLESLTQGLIVVKYLHLIVVDIQLQLSIQLMMMTLISMALLFTLGTVTTVRTASARADTSKFATIGWR